METRNLGGTAPAVTAVGFGAMPLSISGRPPEPEAMRVFHAVLDAGVTLIDTADVYCLDDDDIGHSERLIARALETWSGDPDAILVATKGGLRRPEGRWERDARPEHLRRACDRSLAALGVEQIALYQLHAPDPAVPFADSVGALADLRREGKIRWVGLSNVSVREIEAAAAIVEIVSVQNRLNPFFREAIETGVVAHCQTQGIGFLAYSPLGGGRLNRKLPDHQAVQRIARAHDRSAHAVVLAWVLAQGPHVIPIPGARTVAHALDSITAADLTLTPEEHAAITTARFDPR